MLFAVGALAAVDRTGVNVTLVTGLLIVAAILGDSVNYKILRTFAPFVAGVGKMPYPRFIASNIGGGAVWVTLFCGAEYLFGNIPAVKKQFHIIIIAIIVISLIPAVVEALRARSSNQPAS